MFKFTLKGFIFTLTVSVILGITGCGGGSSTVSTSSGGAGLAAKGPFQKGSSVVAYKLNSDGSRSSTSQNTTTTDAKGNFSFGTNLPWSGPTEFAISGSYLNENTGTYMTLPADKGISAVVELTEGENKGVNINIFTNIAAKAIKEKMANGTSLAIAKSEAQNDLKKLFNIPGSANFEDLDLTKGSGDNADANTKLLMISSALLNTSNPEDVLDKLAEDLKDGTIDGEGVAALDELKNKIGTVDLKEIAANLEESTGATDVPDSESVLNGTMSIDNNINFGETLDANRSTKATSNEVVIDGIYGGTGEISITGGEISIDGSAFGTSTSTISNGQKVIVRVTSSSNYSDTKEANITIAGATFAYKVITKADPNIEDKTPNDFSFGFKRDIAPNSDAISEAIAITGINQPVEATIDKGAFDINSSGTFVTSATITNGSTLRVKIAAGDIGTQTVATLSVGDKDGTFSVFATPIDKTPDSNISFADAKDVAIETTVVSNTITVTGINTDINISISGPNSQYSINNGSWTNISGSIGNGDSIRVRHISANTPGATTLTILNIGNVTLNFVSKTLISIPLNNPPTASATTITVSEDTPKTFNLSSLVGDADGDTLTFSISSTASNGSVTVSGDGVATYTPNANFNGADSFVYGVSDGNGGEANATVTITVDSVNDAPTASATTITVSEDTPKTFNLSSLVGDADGDALIFSIVSTTKDGSVTVSGDGVATYTPNANFNGADSFVYGVSDGNGGEANATVTITVDSVNDAPAISSIDDITVQEDSGAYTLNINATDIDGDTLTFDASASDTSLVALSLNGSTLTITPIADKYGETTITVSANDGNQTSSTTFKFTVTNIAESISGTVVDGYVANAKILVYSDSQMLQQIGLGTTDSNGDFNITITVDQVPDPIYIRSIGGTIIDNGMSAPNMSLIGSSRNGVYNITPISTTLFDMVSSGDLLVDAEAKLESDLNLSTTQLYDNPMEDNGTLTAMQDGILAGNTLTSTLADGNYSVIVITLDAGDVGDITINSVSDIENEIGSLSVNITNGIVQGSIDGVAGSRVNGVISGTTLLLNVLEQSGEFTSVAGTVGQYGSSSGVTSYVDPNNGDNFKGFYVAQFIPQNITYDQVVKITNDMAVMSSKPQDFIYRILMGNAQDIGIGTFIPTNVSADLNITLANSSATEGSGMVDLIDFSSNESRFARTTVAGVSNFPTSFSVKKFAIHDGNTSNIDANIYVIQPMGTRKALVMATDPSNGRLFALGDAYLSTKNTVVPNLLSDTPYNIAIALVHAGMVGGSRANMLAQQMIDDGTLDTIKVDFGDTYTPITQAFRYQPNPDQNGTDIMLFSGSVIGMYGDDNLNDFNDTSDYMNVIQMYRSGAFDGEAVNGGVIDDGLGGTVDLSSYPGVFVGFINPSGKTPLSFNKELKFASRPLYTMDSNTSSLSQINYGYIRINSDSNATLTLADEPNYSIGLSADFTNGIYHIYGTIDPTDGSFIDIAWPTGGKKAIYAISTSEDDSAIVVEVGEAYMNF